MTHDTHPTALVLVGHGSSKTGESSSSIYRHARTLFEQSVSAVVRVAFWKEEPYLHTAFSGLDMPTVVVPMFMADGYFAGRVVPRELGLDDRDPIAYTAPLGVHRGLVEVARDELESVAAVDRHLIVVGHGTPRDPNSRTTAQLVTETLAETEPFRSATCAFIDDEPTVASAIATLPADAFVVVLPFFIADGPHTRGDLPVALGLPARPTSGPHRVGGRTVQILPAVGEADGIGRLVRDLADEGFDGLGGQEHVSAPEIATQFADIVGDGLQLGEVTIAAATDGWCLGRGPDGTPLKSLWDLHDRARRGADGSHRPLRSAPGLAAGWQFTAATSRELVEAVEVLYPGTVDALLNPGRVARPLDDVIATQSGRYARLSERDHAQRRDTVRSVCDRGCLRDRVWDGGDPERGRPPCPRACNVLLDALV